MNFLVISDSHRNRINIDKAYDRCGPLDAIFFLGDGTDDFDDSDRFRGTPLFCVRGNCDTDEGIPLERTVTFEGYKIMLSHGYLYGIESTYFDKAAIRAAAVGADILLLGHTHFPLEKYLPEGTKIGEMTLTKPLRVFNPGSVGKLRADTGFKYHFGTMKIKGDDVLFGHGVLQ